MTSKISISEKGFIRPSLHSGLIREGTLAKKYADTSHQRFHPPETNAKNAFVQPSLIDHDL